MVTMNILNNYYIHSITEKEFLLVFKITVNLI